MDDLHAVVYVLAVEQAGGDVAAVDRWLDEPLDLDPIPAPAGEAARPGWGEGPDAEAGIAAMERLLG